MKLPSGIREIAFGVAALLGGSTTNAQQPACNADPFLAVSSWTGTVSIIGTGNGTLTDSFGTVYNYNVRQSIQLGPVMKVSNDLTSFTGPENVTVNINDTWTTTQAGLPPSVTVVTANGTSTMGFFGGGAILTMSSLPQPCGYAFGADISFSPVAVAVDGQSSQGQLNWGAVNIPNLLVPPATVTAPQTFVPYPSSGTTLSGNVSFSASSWDIPSNFPISPAPVINWTISWSFNPTPRPLDLLVSIPGYQTWRPTAGLNETDINVGPNNPANLLEIKAQLVYQDTQQPTPFAPNKITFTLVPVSREPGVTLNWPAAQNPNSLAPPDMSFIDLSGKNNINPDYQPNADGTQAVEAPPATDISPVFDIFLVPYDWGAWATLQVTAEVDGQANPIQGHLVSPAPSGGAQVTDILLPQRQPGSSIADSWKNAHNIPLSTPDTDDSENNPDGNSAYEGDGLSLYEEYRGFYVHCQACRNGLLHVEGDPKKKDLFVINTTGRPEIDAGVGLFKRTSGLNVCCRTLGPDQIGAGNVINFNHGTAHLVDQHVVPIVDGKSGAPACTSLKNLMPGPPREVNQIFIPPISDYAKIAQSIQSFGLVPWDVTDQMSSTVAHELGHASSIWHHGTGDEPFGVFWYTPDGTQLKEIGKGVSESVAQSLQTTGAGNPIQAFLEDRTQLTPQILGLNVGDLLSLYQGVTAGQHGGDVFCIMRYNTSYNYIATSNASWRYVAVEYPGLSLTDITAGTGTNVAGRVPQSRYGNAGQSFGDCSKQLCINDNLTPTPRGSAATEDCSTEQQ
jgi:hypothetical protein